MREFTIAEVVSAVKGRLICGSGDGSVLKVCTDSRLAKPGDLFFPLIGEKNNGHDYLVQVFERGCRSVIVSEPEKIPKRAFLSDGMQPECDFGGEHHESLAGFGGILSQHASD